MRMATMTDHTPENGGALVREGSQPLAIRTRPASGAVPIRSTPPVSRSRRRRAAREPPRQPATGAARQRHPCTWSPTRSRAPTTPAPGPSVPSVPASGPAAPVLGTGRRDLVPGNAGSAPAQHPIRDSIAHSFQAVPVRRSASRASHVHRDDRVPPQVAEVTAVSRARRAGLEYPAPRCGDTTARSRRTDRPRVVDRAPRRRRYTPIDSAWDVPPLPAGVPTGRGVVGIFLSLVLVAMLGFAAFEWTSGGGHATTPSRHPRPSATSR